MNLQNLSTHRLLQLYRQEQANLRSGDPDDWEYLDYLYDIWGIIPISGCDRTDVLKAILDTREHIPSRKERKLRPKKNNKPRTIRRCRGRPF